MVNNHADKRPDDDSWINFTQRAVALTLGNVAAQKFVNAPDKFLKKTFPPVRDLPAPNEAAVFETPDRIHGD